MGGDYASTVRFLGITENTEVNSWQRALYTSEYMLGDPYIIDSVHAFIRKKIDEAKIGKLIVRGNYQLASGDPFALMQSVCGLKVTGLLRAGECYSKFWLDREEKEVVVFRSPMTSHNNIRMCRVSPSEACQRWYQYMDTAMIINAWDSFCMAENGCDWDGDILFSTNNAVLKRRYRELPAIECVQRSAPKAVITESEIKKTNKNGMGNQVGAITNYVTSMMEVQSHFEKTSREYKELAYRIGCGQLYQQAELDKIKGIAATPMPGRWYNMRACGEDRFLQSICAYRKPYFMIYIYEETKRDYKKYVKESNIKCHTLYNCSVQDLYDNRGGLSDEQREFLFWYKFKMPVGTGPCSMNKICRYVESQLDGFRSQLHKSASFDYKTLKTKRRCTEEHRQALKELEQYYCECVRQYKSRRQHDKGEANRKRHSLYAWFHRAAKEICPNDEERLNIVLDLTYAGRGNRQFFWDCVGEELVKRLEEINRVHTE